MSTPALKSAATPKVLSVSDLSSAIKGTLQRSFTSVWVGGEVSDFSRPGSGHIYLTLKDAHARIKAIIWRSVATRLRFDLADGLEVICHGDVDAYAPQGIYQLVIRSVEPRGLGVLQLAFKRLYERLSAEGLFDPRRKRPLPRFPQRIAFVTSPTGAAVRDFLEVVRRRWQGAAVLIVPVRVQGEGAAAEIARGIRLANQLSPAPDVLVVGRGGGSIEDLWCFNEEPVVRAIHASQIPVVSAVGHEIDVTLSDLVADVRALTPSEAAERVVPSTDELRNVLAGHQQRLRGALVTRAEHLRSRLDAFAQRGIFRRPFDALKQRSRRVDELDLRAGRAIRRQLETSRTQLAALTGQLEGLSPLAVLDRGYSVTTLTSTGALLRSSTDISPGDSITTRLPHGTLTSQVLESEI